MPKGEINYLYRRDSPCKVCGGIVFYPLKNSCVRCARKKNGDKIRASYNNGKQEKPIKLNRTKEDAAMENVWYD